MVNVFSFCLYGPSNPRYYPTLIENIRVIGQYYPTWKVYVYTAPDVDPAFLDVLKTWSNVEVKPTGELGAINMIHRFYAIDEPEVDIMMVRDADSIVHWKDRWAINRFLETPGCVAHAIRDHKDHNTRIMGGLWGMRKSAGINIHEAYESYKSAPKEYGMGHDQNFLIEKVYYVLPNILVHYSFGLVLEKEISEPFPFTWSPDVYCGRIEHTPSRNQTFNILNAFKFRS